MPLKRRETTLGTEKNTGLITLPSRSQCLALQFVGYSALCNSLNLSVSQFPHLFNRKNNTFLAEFLGD